MVLTVLQKRVLRRRLVFRPTREDMTGGCRKLHKEELHNLYSSPSIIRMNTWRRMRFAWQVVRMKEKRMLVGKPERKKPLGRPRRRWVDNIKIILREIEWDCMDWINCSQDRNQWRALVNAVMNFEFHKMLGTVGCFSRSVQFYE
jgi:hypothetical protein